MYTNIKILQYPGLLGDEPKEFNLQMIKGTSEKIFDKYQEEVKKAFEKRIVSGGNCYEY